METVENLRAIEVTSADQPKPATNPEFPRMYEHNLCPFVEKARLAFAAHNVKYQKCAMDLSKKTQWHLDINGGLVPVLKLPDGTLLPESKILMEYAEEAYHGQGYNLYPDDPIERAQIRLAMTF